LLLFDLDHFKAINDRLGHAEGDRVLQAFCDGVSQRLRKADVFGRIGGEEFACLVQGLGTRPWCWPSGFAASSPRLRPVRRVSASAWPAAPTVATTCRACCPWPTVRSMRPRARGATGSRCRGRM